jgi:hypothetical protein
MSAAHQRGTCWNTIMMFELLRSFSADADSAWISYGPSELKRTALARSH